MLDASDNSAVANAVLSVGQTPLATTDNSGNFQLSQKLSTGQITVVAPGYAPLTVNSKDALTTLKLTPNTVSGLLVDATSNQPLGGMPVKSGTSTTNTDKDGKFVLSRVTDGSTLEINMLGYKPISQKIDLKNNTGLTITATSSELTGTLLDAQTGKPVPNAHLSLANQMANSTAAGTFYFADATSDDAQLKVRAPGYKVQTFKVADARKGIKLEPFHFRGVYVPGVFAIRANYNQLFAPYLQMADKNEINSIVVGVKDDDTGELFYDSQTPQAKQFGLIYGNGQSSAQLIDMQHMLDEGA